MNANVVSWSQRWASRSINLRLLLAVLLMVLLALPVAGWLLAHHYRTAAVNAFDERLEATLNVVIAGVTYDPLAGQLNYERALGDPRFDHVYSGWYWQITDDANHSVTSRSLWDQRLPVLESERVTARTLPGPRGQQLRVVERDIYLAPLETPLHVSVAARDDDLREDIQEFQQMLWLGLLGLGALLLGVLALQVRWGLAPLRRMNANLREVEQGRTEQLETRLPDELATLAKSMNAVLARDQRLIERGRHTAGNLAHALKHRSASCGCWPNSYPARAAVPGKPSCRVSIAPCAITWRGLPLRAREYALLRWPSKAHWPRSSPGLPG